MADVGKPDEPRKPRLFTAREEAFARQVAIDHGMQDRADELVAVFRRMHDSDIEDAGGLDNLDAYHARQLALWGLECVVIERVKQMRGGDPSGAIMWMRRTLRAGSTMGTDEVLDLTARIEQGGAA